MDATSSFCPPLVRACCSYALVALIDPTLPNNAGLARVVETSFREGTVLNPTYPAAVGVRDSVTVSPAEPAAAGAWRCFAVPAAFERLVEAL